MEGGALVAEALLAGAESTEVLGGLGDNAVIEVEVDAAALDCKAESDVSNNSNVSKWAGKLHGRWAEDLSLGGAPLVM